MDAGLLAVLIGFLDVLGNLTRLEAIASRLEAIALRFLIALRFPRRFVVRLCRHHASQVMPTINQH